ncbi:hypothetical protein E2K80_11760 [Rhodophyticola sp. CCM32]|uniref:tetrahydrofolate dehydrogenase/cyclohydrolase catalytic domain-containing protein n=1 Tax=Rhodophyticola sp. CCM32 TaxID=2916397 RepID=UPI00107F18CC|nr:tetrahydrofolate dehydrogenase/cyclohydrolase catalytic domain-containing protein [Rhodophyticola sp. CCM32]QBY01319.1 hypothetical protein E2K80_11760 [Rhodophyticola sp. CCM32]
MTVTRAVLLDGDALAAIRLSEMTARVAALADAGIVPHLTTILVGNDPASEAYLKRKHADCAKAGIGSEAIVLDAETSQDDLMALIARLNADASRHGVLIQLPLPNHLDTDSAVAAVDPAKDVDGFHPMNLGRLLWGSEGTLPCTPAGILDLLQAHHVPLAGQRVVIIGRGSIVGRPLAMLLSRKGVDADVTLLHSRSGDVGGAIAGADIVISAVGQPDFIRADMIRPGASVLGIGISYAEGEMVSDIAGDVAEKASFVTPRHGSVGALTRAHLLLNLVAAAEATQPDTLQTGYPPLRSLVPDTIAPPFARYSHGVEMPAGMRLVATSGQLGLAADGTVPEGARAQADLCFASCTAILGAAGMGPGDVIRINAFVTAREHMQGYMEARDAWLADVTHLPASTLVIVSGFTRSEFLVEVEVTAAAM